MLAELTPDGDLCPECKGSGLAQSPERLIATMVYEPCDNCEGEGYLPRCGECSELLQHVRSGKWQCNGEHDG
jgi:DnaJ-class molecular chaperone